MDTAFLVDGFLTKCTRFLGNEHAGFLGSGHTGFLARRVKAPSLVVPWFNRPFVACETPVLHVIGVAINDKLPDKDVALAI